VYLPSGEPKNNIFLISSLNSQTPLPPPNPGGISSNLFLVYVPPPLPQMATPTLPSQTQLSLDSVSFSSDKVESLLSNLDSDSATGPDSRYQLTCPKNLLLCSCSPSLCSIHPLICSRSSAIYLEISKHYCPVQEGAKTDPCNDRPISLLPIISKAMESIIASDIKSFLFSNGLISDNQFGFRPGHSTL